MSIEFGRDVCGNLADAETREWLVTNGIGGYASGTVAGLLTRCYHGLLVAALDPPLGRTLLLTKLDETAQYDGQAYPLYTNRWTGGTVDPLGYLQIESFWLEGTIPVWRYACADALLEKRIWMQQGTNTTYIRYTLLRASQPLTLSLKALVNYRDAHGFTEGQGWQMQIQPVTQGIQVKAFAEAIPFYLQADRGQVTPQHDWYTDFALAVEHYRGLRDREDHLHAADLNGTLNSGESWTVTVSTQLQANQNNDTALYERRTYEQKLIQRWQDSRSSSQASPDWVKQLILAADQFIVGRSPGAAQAEVKKVLTQSATSSNGGKTVIAGYHWFGDWGRDTMISLPGLTLATGRPEIARSILRTFAQYVDQGMIPNRFPDAGEIPEYNTVDATLWFFEAVRLYYSATADDALLDELFPILAEIIDCHSRGTRYQIHLDASDGLLYAGEPGVQLTWMDAKVDDWVVTPRIGKPVEVNALWYSALRTIARFARQLGKPHQEYVAIADRVQARFNRFWNDDLGYCYDVLDSPDGNDPSLRPNQIFAVSLPAAAAFEYAPLLSPAQQRSVVETCGRALLTSYGLRSLAPSHPQYQGIYGGDRYQRDGAYHQGTVWGWLLGPFAMAHLHVYQNPALTRTLLEPMAHHLRDHGVGNLSEIFDGNPPFTPRGCIAQAWTVAEVLRVWMEVGR